MAMNLTLRHTVWAVVWGCCSTLALAADGAPVVAKGPENTALTTVDLVADAQRLPVQVRDDLLARPDNVVQMANNLMMRRVLAQRAESLAQQPEYAAMLRVARDKVLSDIWLDHMDAAAAPSAAQAEGMARDIYRANAERFTAPEQVQARHILVMGDTDEAKAKAEAALKQLQDGADFAQLAAQVSDDKGSAQRGGDLGTFGKGRMVPEFEQVAFALKVGERSSLVKSQFGWHIIEKTGATPAKQQSYEEVREALIQEVNADVQKLARSKALEAIRSEITVDQAAVKAFSQSYAPESKH